MVDCHTSQPARTNSRRVRSIFISDVHLGCKHSRAEALAEFLDAHEPEHLYLVGDIIDGWKLASVWRWLPEYNRLMQRCIKLAQGGTRLYYTPGNHDAFLRKFLYNFGFIEVSDEFIHKTADRRRMLVIHGDKFDRFEKSARWFSVLASFAYDALLSANRLASKWQKKSKRSAYAFSAAVKIHVKQLVMFLSDFERLLVEHAQKLRCDGVICGHIHKPGITQNDTVTYFNTGDWVEHCTALVEYDDGSMELQFLSTDGEDGQIEVVDRIAGPKVEAEPTLDDDHWHDEFDDGFAPRFPGEWGEPAPGELPVPAGVGTVGGISTGGSVVAAPPKPKNRIRRFAQKLRGWPKAVAERAILIKRRLWAEIEPATLEVLSTKS